MQKNIGAYFTSTLFKDLKNRKDYEDNNEDPALVTGIETIENENYCYIKLDTFDLSKEKDLTYKIF